MTAFLWLDCADPLKMLKYLGALADERQLRLFATACCRRLRPKSMGARSQRLLDMNERYADGLVPRGSVEALRRNFYLRGVRTDWHAAVLAATDPDYSKSPHPAVRTAVQTGSAGGESQHAAQCDLIRCLMGPPYVRRSSPAVWRTPTVIALAVAAARDRRPRSGELNPLRFRVLADVLEEAGCTDDSLLGHCRGAGLHVRGCWALDALLGKK